ncbi:hypothetical protein V1477_020362 [Vespula maculifrons]|uniref:Uncharacterized protein n=1 Tax=Vespula maculifrons TaxID=7453 RepID=A0ABD2ALQ1_VESMC
MLSTKEFINYIVTRTVIFFQIFDGHSFFNLFFINPCISLFKVQLYRQDLVIYFPVLLDRTNIYMCEQKHNQEEGLSYGDNEGCPYDMYVYQSTYASMHFVFSCGRKVATMNIIHLLQNFFSCLFFLLLSIFYAISIKVDLDIFYKK